MIQKQCNSVYDDLKTDIPTKPENIFVCVTKIQNIVAHLFSSKWINQVMDQLLQLLNSLIVHINLSNERWHGASSVSRPSYNIGPIIIIIVMNWFCLSGMNYKVIYSRLKTQNFTPGQRQEKKDQSVELWRTGGWMKKSNTWGVSNNKTHAYQTREPGEKEVCFSTTCVTPLESAISMHIWGRATVVDKESKKTKKRKRWRRWIACVQKGCNEFALNERKSKHSSKFSELN